MFLALSLAKTVIPHDTSTTKNGIEGKVKRYAFSTRMDENDKTPIAAGGAPNIIVDRTQPSI